MEKSMGKQSTILPKKSWQLINNKEKVSVEKAMGNYCAIFPKKTCQFTDNKEMENVKRYMAYTLQGHSILNRIFGVYQMRSSKCKQLSYIKLLQSEHIYERTRKGGHSWTIWYCPSERNIGIGRNSKNWVRHLRLLDPQTQGSRHCYSEFQNTFIIRIILKDKSYAVITINKTFPKWIPPFPGEPPRLTSLAAAGYLKPFIIPDNSNTVRWCIVKISVNDL